MIEAIPLLTLLLIAAPIGAVAIWIAPDPRRARLIALVTGVVILLLAIAVLIRFDSGNPDFQLLEQHSWIPTLNINYLVGVDGISVLFLPLTAVLFIGVILSSWTRIASMAPLYFSMLLLLETATLGVFCALDTILFFFFWELTLVPLYFLISLWGVGPNRRYAAVKYTLFMLAGGVPLLFGFVLLAFNYASVHNGILAFDLPSLLATPLSDSLGSLVFFLLLAGFAVKTPIFPLHTWLPVVAQEGPASVAALLVGLKLGAFGLIRFVVPLTSEAAQTFHWLLAAMGVIGILYGGLLAMGQTNLRRMLAYSSISHVGLVLLGIASFNIQGIQGALFHLLNFTVVAGGLFILTGLLHHRIGSTDVLSLGGAAHSMPLLAAFFFLFGLASMGVPGTNGFPAELLILISALKTHTGAGLAALTGIVIGAAYFLRLYRQVFFGPIKNAVVQQAMDLRPRERFIAICLALIILFLGLYPASVLDLTKKSSTAWVERLNIH
ncbi:MAG: NADH-quinone oxidoreductase subunit M [Thiothrix sp.]|nr:MAG: NADH-quinone oxidoreductase subunit M [Thiothrix sp.]